jgi:predicted dinucleotide-binding enzyme
MAEASGHQGERLSPDPGDLQSGVSSRARSSSALPPGTPEVIQLSFAQAKHPANGYSTWSWAPIHSRPARVPSNEANRQHPVMTSHLPDRKPGSVGGLARPPGGRASDSRERPLHQPPHPGQVDFLRGIQCHERWSNVTISDRTVAIIGTGNIGGILAADFAAGGQNFLLAGREQETARKIASDLGGHAEAVSVDEAVDRAGMLVLAVWLDAFEQLIAQYGERLDGKVIIDPTNPIGPDGQGGVRKVIREQESSGQILAGLLPAGARLVKAFGTLSAPTLSAVARREPERAVLFYAADDVADGDLVADLIRLAGFDPIRVGGLDQSIRIEMFGDLHEVGALGRVVTRTEALQAI